ncbi:FUSC family protein [Streptomyces sp. NBC_01497]|uniref:FUSC family protein n=1 Tax=Streptomyces sp. NBC_01497 TaxID=2903885 RepID=UPI002E349D21|nr:FUSC family protein [Streptomyces sp. NBC_01497]
MILEWLRSRDPKLMALRRAARAGIVSPGLFAFGVEVLHNSTVAAFTAFGSLALLLFVDFTGPLRERVVQQGALVVAGAIQVCAGTLASRQVWIGAGVMLVVAFIVLFSGVVSSVLAGASTSLLIAFILAVTLPGPADSLTDRLTGWLMAGAVSVVAVGVLWPAPDQDPLRAATAQACRAIARQLRAEVSCRRGGLTPDLREVTAQAVSEATAAVDRLRTSFFAVPYRPTGLSTAGRTLVRLVDQVVWLDAILQRGPFHDQAQKPEESICKVELAAADLLDQGASILRSADVGEKLDAPEYLSPRVQNLRELCAAMEATIIFSLPRPQPETTSDTSQGPSGPAEPGFRAQQMSFGISSIAANIDLITAAARRAWWQRLLGRRPKGIPSPVTAAQKRAASHVQWNSVSLHNSVRGAMGLALAVLVAGLTGVEHSFWVVFGTLAVLRSNALTTGQNAARAIAGTTAGIVVGGITLITVGTDTTALWVLLPVGVFFTGLAPATFSFAAGQAGFTGTLLILFTIVDPEGLGIGLTRIEDVVIGCTVSVLVGALFWPRGAGTTLRKSLAEALSDAAAYLRSAVAFGVTPDRTDACAVASQRSAAAARRLDDTFRGYLAERGTKHFSLNDVTALITAVAVLRLTADAVLALWADDTTPPGPELSVPRGQLLGSASQLVEWYEAAALALVQRDGTVIPAPSLSAADSILSNTAWHHLVVDEPTARTAVRVVWTAEHIEAAEQLRPGIVQIVRAAAGPATGAHSVANPLNGLRSA